MNDYIGGANVTDTVHLFLVNDSPFLTYMVLLGAGVWHSFISSGFVDRAVDVASAITIIVAFVKR